MLNKSLMAIALMGAAALGGPGMAGTARTVSPVAISSAKVKSSKGRVSGGGGRKKGNRSGKTYPFSSARQHARHAAFQHTVTVNGFPLMQTVRRSSASERAFDNAYAAGNGTLSLDGKIIGTVSKFKINTDSGLVQQIDTDKATLVQITGLTA